MPADLQDVPYRRQGLNAALPDGAAYGGPVKAALPAQVLATAVPPWRLGGTPVPLHSTAGTVPVAAAELHPQEGQPTSSTKQLATGHASELNACARAPRTEARGAVEGPSAVAVATAAAPASEGRACEPATCPGRAVGSAPAGTGSAAMAASSALDGAGTAAMAFSTAARPVGRAAEAAGCSCKPAGPATRKRKAAKAGPTDAAQTGSQKRARLSGEAAAALRMLRKARQQHYEDAAGPIAVLQLESVRLQQQQGRDAARVVARLQLESRRLQQQRRLQWQAMRPRAGQTLHRRSRGRDPARVLPQPARPSAQPLRKRSSWDSPARPVPPDRQGFPSCLQPPEGAVAGGEREQQGAVADGGPSGPGGSLAVRGAPQLWGAAHGGATHAGLMQPPEPAALPGRVGVPPAASCAPCQPGSMYAGGCWPPQVCLQHSEGPSRCSLQLPT